MQYSIEDVEGGYISLDATDSTLTVLKIKQLIENNVRFDFITCNGLAPDIVDGVRALI